jgi:hypothetical protein
MLRAFSYAFGIVIGAIVAYWLAVGLFWGGLILVLGVLKALS